MACIFGIVSLFVILLRCGRSQGAYIYTSKEVCQVERSQNDGGVNYYAQYFQYTRDESTAQTDCSANGACKGYYYCPSCGGGTYTLLWPGSRCYGTWKADITVVKAREAATCAVYSCPTNYVVKNSASTTYSQSNCCQATCAAYSCPTNYVVKNIASTTYSESNCCEATCAAYPCPSNYTVKNSDSTAYSQSDCCEAICYGPSVTGYDLTTCRSTIARAGWNPSCGGCSAGYEGSVTHTVCGSAGTEWSVSGCQAVCNRPSATGYDLTTCRSTIARAGWNPFCGSCSAGYEGSVTHTVCGSAGTEWSVSGCQAQCKSLTCPTGYRYSPIRLESTGNITIAFCCELTCAAYTCPTGSVLVNQDTAAFDEATCCLECPNGEYERNNECVVCTGATSRRRASSCASCKEGEVNIPGFDDCEETCRRFDCGAGYEANEENADSYIRTTANCCKETCTLYPCDEGYLRVTSPPAKPSTDTCCEQSCKLFGCGESYAKKANTNLLVGTQANCCQETCALFVCDANDRKNPNQLQSTTYTNDNCCEATCAAITCVTNEKYSGSKKQDASEISPATEENCCETRQPCNLLNRVEVCTGVADVCYKGYCHDEAETPPCNDGYRHDFAKKTRCSIFSRGTFCTNNNCIDGADYVGQGFDFTSQIVSQEAVTQGAKKYIIGSTQAHENTVELHGSIFQINQLLRAHELTGSSLKSGYTTFTSSSAFQRHQAAESSIEGNYGDVVDASASAKYDLDIKNSMEQERIVTWQEFEKPLYSVSIDSSNVGANSITEDFEDAVRSLPTSFQENDALNKPIFDTFIEQYGTHYISSVQMGGRVALEVDMHVCAREHCQSELFEGEACASGRIGLTSTEACAEAQDRKDKCKSFYSGQFSSTIDVKGGNDVHCSTTSETCDLDAWKATVTVESGLAQPLAFLMKPLWEAPLPQDVILQKTALKKALEHYVKSNVKPSITISSPSCAPFDQAVDDAQTSHAGIEQLHLYIWMVMLLVIRD